MNLFSQWIAQLSLDHFTPTPSDIFPSNFLPGPLRFHSPLDIFRSLKGEETPSKIVRHLCPFFLFHVRNVFAMRTECPFLPFARFNFFSLLLDARACVRACVCVFEADRRSCMVFLCDTMSGNGEKERERGRDRPLSPLSHHVRISYSVSPFIFSRPAPDVLFGHIFFRICLKS